MSIKRIVPNIESETPQKSIDFYAEFLGLQKAMDMGWIIIFVSESNRKSQVSVLRNKESDSPHPDISIEAEGVDQMFAKAKE